jgi:hypothetical protein
MPGYYYTVPARTVTVAGDTMIEPDLPVLASWSGQPHGASYLLVSPAPIDGLAPLAEAALFAECAARALAPEAVQRWAWWDTEPDAG